MGLRLHDVPPAQGWQWVRLGLKTWVRRPLALIGLFSFFLLMLLLLSVLLPHVGGVLGLALLPMLSLGFMIATRSVLADGPVHPLQLIEGLRVKDPARRKAQWQLCGAYALGSVLVFSLAAWVDAGLFDELQRLMAEAGNAGPDADQTELRMVMADPRLSAGMLVRFGLAALLSVPFWHAPALVHWGGQGAGQALFSSTLGLWRARGAFFVYFLAWGLLMIGAGTLLATLGGLTGSGQAVTMLAMPLARGLSAAFYSSLWFGFRDSYAPDGELDRPQASPPGPTMR